MWTIDASVWINADSHGEPHKAESRQFLDRITTSRALIFVPTLLAVEVAATIARATNDLLAAQQFAERLTQIPLIWWVTLDPAFATRCAAVAAEYRLRGSDAVYAAVAAAYNCALVSLDQEHLTRLSRLVKVQTPAQALANFR